MDYNDDSSCEPWEWQGDDYYLHRDPNLADISPCLWDGANHNEEDLLHVFNETTPVKACSDFDYGVTDNREWISGSMIKVSGECRESSQLKRRRMLQFHSHSTDPLICNEQLPPEFSKSKEGENSMEDTETMQWVPTSTDEGWTAGNECLDQSSVGWLANCLNDGGMDISSDEITNFSGASDEQIDVSEFYNIPPEAESQPMQQPVIRTPRSLFKVISGRKASMQTPTKLAAPVAYPFALVKPCGVQGDVTLKDINQRIRTPPTSTSKHVKDEEALPSYPKSAFSGKPVVVKTKIFTEGGKGSITITRTKG